MSLCSGIGTLDLAVRVVLPDARTVCMVEREAFACWALAEEMEAGILDPCPVWTDLTTFDGRPWAGAVDLVASGIPCQPYSLAGARKGNADDRALWPELVRIVAEAEPAAVFVENTPGLLKQAEPLWLHLRELGFEWAPPCVSTASEVGAIHDRARLFLLAAHPNRERLEIRPSQRSNPCPEREAVERGRGEATDPDDDGRQEQRSGWLFDCERQAFRHDPDRCDMRPSQAAGSCRVCGSLWEAESPACRLDHGSTGWADLIRALGNAVVPLQAAVSFRWLLNEWEKKYL